MMISISRKNLDHFFWVRLLRILHLNLGDEAHVVEHLNAGGEGFLLHEADGVAVANRGENAAVVTEGDPGGAYLRHGFVAVGVGARDGSHLADLILVVPAHGQVVVPVLVGLPGHGHGHRIVLTASALQFHVSTCNVQSVQSLLPPLSQHPCPHVAFDRTITIPHC